MATKAWVQRVKQLDQNLKRRSRQRSTTFEYETCFSIEDKSVSKANQKVT